MNEHKNINRITIISFYSRTLLLVYSINNYLWLVNRRSVIKFIIILKYKSSENNNNN